MARPTNVTDNGLSADFGKPLAVPDLAVAPSFSASRSTG
jgi:hypothetical protein